VFARRPLEAHHSEVAAPTVVKAIYAPPRARRRREVAAPATYRLRLERETPDGAGVTIHAWGGIPHARVGPLLEGLASYLPWLARAAAAREALRKVADLFR
jgi:hypothetical protein